VKDGGDGVKLSSFDSGVHPEKLGTPSFYERYGVLGYSIKTKIFSRPKRSPAITEERQVWWYTASPHLW
jgi:hypothetical protein